MNNMYSIKYNINENGDNDTTIVIKVVNNENGDNYYTEYTDALLMRKQCGNIKYLASLLDDNNITKIFWYDCEYTELNLNFMGTDIYLVLYHC